MKKGNFIVIDGLDGSGKNTQAELLKTYLEEKGEEVSLFDFPQYQKTFFGDLVAKYLRGEFGTLDEVNPYLAALTYAGDRWQAKDEIKNALNKGKLVVSVRYVSASIAFMSAKLSKKERPKFIKWLKKLEYEIYGIPKEDILIYLDVSTKVGRELLAKNGNREYLAKSGKKLDLHEENLEYMQKVELVYKKLLNEQTNWTRIECLDKEGKIKTKPQIHKLIVELLKQKKII